MENTKRDLSLDFTKPRHVRGVIQQPVPSLVTPVLALSTPELNKLISEEELAVLTPNGISSVIPQSNNVLPSPLIPTTVNSNNIINNATNNCNNNNGNSTNGNTITTIGSGNNNNQQSNQNCQNNITNGQKRLDNHNIIDSDGKSKHPKDQDIEKIEKKRERNRLAAKKCRQRKLETIDELRKEVSDWQKKYERLEHEFERYKCLRSKEIEQLTRDKAELKNLIRQ